MSIIFDSDDGDGVDYLENTTITGAITGAPLTFACWVYPESISDWDGCISVAKSSASNQHITLTLRNDATVRAVTRSSSSANSSVGSYTAGAWHHIAGVFASTSSRIAYLDGAAGSENTTDLTPSDVNLLQIGEWASTTSRAMDGRLAECAVWTVGLTSAEIGMLADGFTPNTVRPESLLNYWPMVRDYNNRTRHHAITPNNTVVFGDHPPIRQGHPPVFRSNFTRMGGVATT